MDEKGDLMKGSISLIEKEKGLEFIPGKPWKAGRYSLKIAAYLEDLAGNNLNRPFDRDIKLRQKKLEQDFVEKEFIIDNR